MSVYNIRTQLGFSLTEILIVLLILSFSFSLVAPLTVERIDKYQQNFENKKLLKKVLFLSEYAKWSNKIVELQFQEKTLQVVVEGKPYLVESFTKLNFRKQKLTINRTGKFSSCQLLLSDTSVDLNRVVERCG